jgi:tetratricopeptide (TPR) repeat protein
MADLEGLLKELDQQEAAGDLEGLWKTRQVIVANFGNTPEAVEAAYKVGLHYLFHLRDLDQAVTHFQAAAKHKDPYWSLAARTSLGICLFHQGRGQKALFELRRVGFTETPNDHSVTALAFMETIHAVEAQMDELNRVRTERIKQLYVLIEESRPSKDQTFGQHLFSLATALVDEGDLKAAKACLDEAKELGPDVLGAELYSAVANGF